MKMFAIIVAGGKGLRMGGDLPKQFMLLKGKPLIWHSIRAFITAFPEIRIILVLPSEYLEKGAKLAQEFSASLVAVIAGGDTRFQSVKNGLQSLEDNSLVFVHDAVRCLVTPGLIKRCAEGAIEKGNAVPAISATDTIRIENKSGNEQLDRNKVKIIQTPQVFPAGILKKAFEQPYKYSFTDEASVAEALGVEINLVEGESANIKITTPADLLLAEKILEQPRI